MSKEKAIEYIKRAMDCIDELPFPIMECWLSMI